ncbi:hypothetical protein CDAR_184201 [Caerostris darwini]|uniref:Uncharacterized protein n=1 Tax=Caerostris darwini TaxID=1538125 RepID=A0AAV4VXR6_9ARAC|nr:hypothetical protein CDAR_184201 [Caerostris darwini]
MPGEICLVADEDDCLGVHVVPLVDESQNVLGHLEAPLGSDRVHDQVGVGGVHIGEVLSLQTKIKKVTLLEISEVRKFFLIDSDRMEKIPHSRTRKGCVFQIQDVM